MNPDLLSPMALMDTKELLALAEQLERAAPGAQTWRVANAEGAYCIDFSHADSIDPKGECQRWFDEHRAYCQSRGYSVQLTKAFTHSERVARQVAERLRELACAAAPQVSA